MYASAAFTPGTVARVIDTPYFEGSERRSAAVHFDGAMYLHVGSDLGATDEDIVIAGELLIAAVRELVDAARERIGEKSGAQAA